MEKQIEATFGVIDWGVLLVYCLMVLAIGIWASKGQASNRDFFLGGRNLSWWVVGFSIVATETSALTFIGVPAMAFGALSIGQNGEFVVNGGNMTFLNLIIGYVIGRVLIAIYIVPMYFKGDVYTPFQLLNRAFGPRARYVAATLSIIGMALGAGVRVVVPAIPVTIILQIWFEHWSIWMSVLLIMVVSLAYTSVGGIKAVVWTDMVQYFIFVGGGLFALFYIPTLMTGDFAAQSGAEGWAAIREISGDHFKTWNIGVLYGDELSQTLPEGTGVLGFLWAQIVYIFSGPYSILMGVLPTTIGIILAFGFDQLNVQRVLGCKNVKEGRKAMLFSAILIFPQFYLFLLIGVALYAFYAANGFDFGTVMPWDPATVNEATGVGIPKSDYVFPIFIVNHVPAIFKGLLVAGILAAAMSSVSSALSAMSSIAIMDFIIPLSGKTAEQKTSLNVSRTITVICGLALGVIAVLCKQAEFILVLAFKLAGITGGAILGAFLFAMWKKKGYAGPVIAGMVASFVTMVVYNVLRSYTTFSMSWPWDAVVGMVVCFVIAWLAAYDLPEVKDRSIDTVEEVEEKPA